MLLLCCRFHLVVSIGLLRLAHAADEKCSTLVTFADTCLTAATDDGFDAFCEDYTNLSSEWCVDEGEFVTFYMDQARLAECKEPDGPLVESAYDEIERFKYQCLGDFDGPCNLLQVFCTQA
jgi:hypothetical protein